MWYITYWVDGQAFGQHCLNPFEGLEQIEKYAGFQKFVSCKWY